MDSNIDSESSKSQTASLPISIRNSRQVRRREMMTSDSQHGDSGCIQDMPEGILSGASSLGSASFLETSGVFEYQVSLLEDEKQDEEVKAREGDTDQLNDSCISDIDALADTQDMMFELDDIGDVASSAPAHYESSTRASTSLATPQEVGRSIRQVADRMQRLRPFERQTSQSYPPRGGLFNWFRQP